MSTLSTFIPGFLAARNYSADSRRQRLSILRRFLDAVGDVRPADLSPVAVLDWWASLGELAVASRRAHLSAVRTFLAHLRSLGLIDRDPTATISRPSLHQEPPVIITGTDVIALLAQVDHPRDRAAIALMLGAGLRAGDVCAVNVANVDLNDGLLRVTGKGNRTRLVPLPAPTIAAVRAYLDWQPATDGPLIRGRCGRRMTPDALRRRITHALKSAGVKRGPHDGRASHVLRRTCATHLLRAGANVRDVQQILGHGSLSSTQRYLAEREAHELRAIVERGPLAGIG